MLSKEKFENFTVTELETYLKKRFYAEETNPPISSLHYEPLESFPIDAFTESNNTEFKENLKTAVSNLLYDWSAKPLLQLSEKEEDYLKSLCSMIAFLKVESCYNSLLSLVQKGSTYKSGYFSAETESKLLYAFASIQKPGISIELWYNYWKLDNPEFYEISFTGLRRASIDEALKELCLLIDRAKDDFLSNTLWALYHQPPDGKEKLKSALDLLDETKKNIFFSALKKAGMEENEIQELRGDISDTDSIKPTTLRKILQRTYPKVIQKVPSMYLAAA